MHIHLKIKQLILLSGFLTKLILGNPASAQTQISNFIYPKEEIVLWNKIVRIDSGKYLLENQDGLSWLDESFIPHKLFIRDSVHLKQLVISNDGMGIFTDSLNSSYFCKVNAGTLELIHFVRFDDHQNKPFDKRYTSISSNGITYLCQQGLRLLKVDGTITQIASYASFNWIGSIQNNPAYILGDTLFVNAKKISLAAVQKYWSGDFIPYKGDFYINNKSDSTLYRINLNKDSPSPEPIHKFGSSFDTEIINDTLFIHTPDTRKQFFCTGDKIIQNQHPINRLIEPFQLNSQRELTFLLMWNDVYVNINQMNSSKTGYLRFVLPTGYGHPTYNLITHTRTVETETSSLSFFNFRGHEALVYLSGEDTINTSLGLYPIDYIGDSLLIAVSSQPDYVSNSFYKNKFYKINLKNLHIQDIEFPLISQKQLTFSSFSLRTGSRNIAIGNPFSNMTLVGNKNTLSPERNLTPEELLPPDSTRNYFLNDSVYTLPNTLVQHYHLGTYPEDYKSPVIYFGINSSGEATFFSPEEGLYTLNVELEPPFAVIYDSSNSYFFIKDHQVFHYDLQTLKLVFTGNERPNIKGFPEMNTFVINDLDESGSMSIYRFDPKDRLFKKAYSTKLKTPRLASVSGNKFIYQKKTHYEIAEITADDILQKEPFWGYTLNALREDGNVTLWAVSTDYRDNVYPGQSFLFSEKDPYQPVLAADSYNLPWVNNSFIFTSDNELLFYSSQPDNVNRIHSYDLNNFRHKTFKVKSVLSDDPLFFESTEDGIFFGADSSGFYQLNNTPIHDKSFTVDDNSLYIYGQTFGTIPQIYKLDLNHKVEPLWETNSPVDFTEENGAIIFKSIQFDQRPINVYPNPFQDKVTIDVSGIGGYKYMEIVDSQGKLIFRKGLVDTIWANSGVLLNRALRNLVHGTYIIHLIGKDDSVHSVKIVKK